MWVGRQSHDQAALHLVQSGCPLCKKLDGPEDRSGRVRKYLTPQEFDPRFVHPVASRYTNAISLPDCTQYCYIMDTFPSQSHSRNNTKQNQSPLIWRQRDPSNHQNKRFSKATSELAVILTPAVKSVAPGSNLNAETRYTYFGVFVVLFRISRKISQ